MMNQGGPHSGKKGLVVGMELTRCLVMWDHPVRCDGNWVEKINCQWIAAVWRIRNQEYSFQGVEGPVLEAVRLLMGSLVDEAAMLEGIEDGIEHQGF